MWGKDFDKYLLVKKGAAEYHADKVKAGAMGGAALRGKTKPTSKRNAEIGALSSIKKMTTISVVCLKDLNAYRAGNHYEMVIIPTIEIVSPYRYKLEDWGEFLDHFKRLKVLKQKDESYPRRKPTGSIKWYQRGDTGFWRARISYNNKRYEVRSISERRCREWLEEKRKELGV